MKPPCFIANLGGIEMNKKTKGLLVIGIISILFISFLAVSTKNIQAKSYGNESKSDISTLRTAFNKTASNLVEWNMNYWSSMEEENLTVEEMKEIALNLEKKLNLDQEGVLEEETFENYNKISISNQSGEEIFLTIIVESLEESGIHENYILVDLSLDHTVKEIEKYEETIKDYLEDLNCEVEESITMVGNFDEKLNISEMREKIGDSFESIEARILEGIEETEYGEMVSLTGYSPQIHNTIELGEREININGALRYNEYEGKTYLWLGSPLIATEY